MCWPQKLHNQGVSERRDFAVGSRGSGIWGKVPRSKLSALTLISLGVTQGASSPWSWMYSLLPQLTAGPISHCNAWDVDSGPGTMGEHKALPGPSQWFPACSRMRTPFQCQQRLEPHVTFNICWLRKYPKTKSALKSAHFEIAFYSSQHHLKEKKNLWGQSKHNTLHGQAVYTVNIRTELLTKNTIEKTEGCQR